MKDILIKEKAFDKAFAMLQGCDNQKKDLLRCMSGTGFGGLSLEQTLGLLEFYEGQKAIWLYITCLIEKDDVL
jgi:hypothetical protein